MISIDVSKLVQELKDYKIEVTKRLENMVRGFTYEFAMIAIDNTPLGDDKKYAALYQRRTYLQPKAGFAQGSWQVPTDMNGTLEQQDLYSGSAALSAIQTHMLNYKLGETFVLGNTGPYIQALESGKGSKIQAPNGIMAPTIDQMLAAYKVNLTRYYQQ